MRKTSFLKRPVRRAATAIEKTYPPPVGGWNARDSLASMHLTDAVELVNWFPRSTSVETRKGSLQHMTFNGVIHKTLAVHRQANGQETLWAMSDAGIAEATFGGVSGAFFLTTRTNGKHQWENFGDGTNNWLIAVNGVDKPWYWNGTTYVLVDGATSPAITGITTTDIVSLAVFKERLLFIRNNKLGFDFLPAGAAGGAASYFDLSSVASEGGYLMAIAVWSRDAGDGPDDYAVFLTSQGEALVYAGTDPSSATTWSLIGTFRIGKPLGRRCVLKYGADPIILTQNGAFPLSALLASGDERNKFAVSFKIQSAFSAAAEQAFDVFGWKAISFPEQDMLIINVPKREDGPHDQYVMNTITKAWCRFTGWHAEDFVVFRRELYYCKGGIIYRAWKGECDEVRSLFNSLQGTPIEYIARQAYQDYGTASIKMPVMFMPLLENNGAYTYTTGVDTDFNAGDFPDGVTSSASGAGIWGSGRWGTARWGGGGIIARKWGATASWPGRWLSSKLRILSGNTTSIDITRSVQARWLGSVMRFMVGEST